jgi:sec-independent protein translocase protein TatC
MTEDGASASPGTSEDSSRRDESRMARMSFGDHLDELRTRLIRAMLGVVVGTIVSLVFGKEILSIIFAPLFVVQAAHGLPPSLQALSPTAGFIAYLKIGFLAGLILTMPWVLYQIWRFVASGLYAHEQRFVRRMVPASVGLFIIGVLFLYFIVLPIVLHFFITFNRSFSPPDPQRSTVQKWLFGQTEETEAELDIPELGHLSVVSEDPEAPEVGTYWVNRIDKRLKVKTPTEVLSVALRRDASFSPVNSQFAIDFYITFVLMLMLAFGIAFELPIVVFFLAWSGIVPADTMAKGRRYVLFGIVVAGAMLTPPDVISQILLALPMYTLFEVGLMVARATERRVKSRA